MRLRPTICFPQRQGSPTAGWRIVSSRFGNVGRSDLRSGPMKRVDLEYPSAEKRAWAGIVKRIAGSLDDCARSFSNELPPAKGRAGELRLFSVVEAHR